MKWDKKAKIRLYAVLGEKADAVESSQEWEIFLGLHGILRAERGDGDAYCRNPAWERLGFSGEIADRKRIIIEDPFFKDRHYGLSVPKEVAEKFLVLGIP